MELTRNFFTGVIPAVNGLHQLRTLYLDSNLLSGSIPSLDGLDNLQYVALSFNQLSGPVPDISALPLLQWFFVGDNHLTGSVGEPPDSLWAGTLCSNRLAATPSARWDSITHTTPWYSACDTDGIFEDTFDLR